MTSKGIRKELDQARTELGELLGDLPKIQSLHTEHQRRLAQATTAARSGDTPIEELARVRNEAESVAGMLRELQGSIGEAQERVRQLEAQYDALEQQDLIDELAEATRQVLADWDSVGRNLAAVILSSLEELARLEAQARANYLEAKGLEGDVPPALRFLRDLRLSELLLGPGGLPDTASTRAAVQALETLKRRQLELVT
jgi:chromosome segregation ATPase